MCIGLFDTENKPSVEELDDDEGPLHNCWRFDICSSRIPEPCHITT